MECIIYTDKEGFTNGKAPIPEVPEDTSYERHLKALGYYYTVGVGTSFGHKADVWSKDGEPGSLVNVCFNDLTYFVFCPTGADELSLLVKLQPACISEGLNDVCMLLETLTKGM